MLYVANSRSAAISIHVDCYLSDGTPETGVRVATDVGALQRFEASLMSTRAPQMQSNGDYREGGEGWFQLWANGPVAPAAVITVILGQSPFELVVPLEPVDIEPVVAVAEAAPPLVTAMAAPEGAAAEESLEANLSLDESREWFESVRSGRRFDRETKTPQHLAARRLRFDVVLVASWIPERRNQASLVIATYGWDELLSRRIGASRLNPQMAQ